MEHSRFRSLMERWLNEQLILDVSKKNQKVALHRFLEFCGERDPDRQLLISWIQGWKGRDSTMQNYASSMRRFFEWLGKEELYKDIGHGLRNYTRKSWEHTHLPLKELEVERLIKYLEGYQQIASRDLVMIMLMINCGLRGCEVRRAKIKDLQDTPGRCLRVMGKGHIYPDALVFLVPDMASMLDFYIRIRPGYRGPESCIFLSTIRPYRSLSARRVSEICRYHLEQVGLYPPTYSAHSFRHTAATIALQRGASEEQVGRMLRHVDPRTTRLYTRYLDRMKNPAERFLDFKLPERTEDNLLPFKQGG